MRDIKDAYRLALVEEYEAYQRSGRTNEAVHVAQVLSKHYGVDMTPKKAEDEKKAEDDKKAEDAKARDDAPERADAERPSEDTAKPQAKRSPGRPRKPAQG